MKTELITITPNIAEQLLGANTHNRHIFKARVQQYALAMKEGRWKVNGEAIKIDKTGRLVDGQHRLSAVIESRQSIKMLVIKELSDDVFDTIDTGKSRGGSDVLYIANVEYPNVLSAGINLYLKLNQSRYIRSAVGGSSYIENQDILEEYNNDPNLYRSLISSAIAFHHRTHRIITPAEYVGAYRYFLTAHDASSIDSFFNNVEDEVGVCGLLYSVLLDNAISKRKMSQAERKALIVKAFNFFITGATVKILRFNRGEEFPLLVRPSVNHNNNGKDLKNLTPINK